jgi:hypothetical protein
MDSPASRPCNRLSLAPVRPAISGGFGTGSIGVQYSLGRAGASAPTRTPTLRQPAQPVERDAERAGHRREVIRAREIEPALPTGDHHHVRHPGLARKGGLCKPSGLAGLGQAGLEDIEAHISKYTYSARGAQGCNLPAWPALGGGWLWSGAGLLGWSRRALEAVLIGKADVQVRPCKRLTIGKPRSPPRAAASSGRSTLSATARPSLRSWARQTVAIPPLRFPLDALF